MNEKGPWEKTPEEAQKIDTARGLAQKEKRRPEQFIQIFDELKQQLIQALGSDAIDRFESTQYEKIIVYLTPGTQLTEQDKNAIAIQVNGANQLLKDLEIDRQMCVVYEPDNNIYIDVTKRII